MWTKNKSIIILFWHYEFDCSKYACDLSDPKQSAVDECKLESLEPIKLVIVRSTRIYICLDVA